MNGYVPVPPARPVVSVSRKSHCRGSAISSAAPGASRRNAPPSNPRSGDSPPMDSENHRRKARYSPQSLRQTEAPRISANLCEPGGTSGDIPRGSSGARCLLAGALSAFNRANGSEVMAFIRRDTPESRARLPSYVRSFRPRDQRKKGTRYRKDTTQSAPEFASAANRGRDRAAR